jgi:hypothetical protein
MRTRELKVHLPVEVKNWLEQAAENASSQSSEVVRSLRERMQRPQNTPAVTAPLRAAYPSPRPEG